MHPNPSAYTRATPRAIRTAKPSRYARVYSGTSPESVIAIADRLFTTFAHQRFFPLVLRLARRFSRG